MGCPFEGDDGSGEALPGHGSVTTLAETSGVDGWLISSGIYAKGFVDQVSVLYGVVRHSLFHHGPSTDSAMLQELLRVKKLAFHPLCVHV